jgi:hypothetical protein
MDEGVSGIGADRSRSEPGPLDAAEFARAIRQLAVEVRRILNHPGATTAEVMRIRRQVRVLLRAFCGRASQQTEIERWLRTAYHAIDAKLPSALEEAPGLI